MWLWKFLESFPEEEIELSQPGDDFPDRYLAFRAAEVLDAVESLGPHTWSTEREEVCE